MIKKVFAVVLMILSLTSYVQAQEFMKVSGERILVNNKRCYQIRKGYSRKDKTPWEPFCGEFRNFYYENGYEYTMHVEKYDASLDTIKVIKTIGRDNSESYRRLQEMRKRSEEAKSKKYEGN